MSWYDQNWETSLEPKLWGWNTGLLVVKPAQLQQSGFSCGETCCNGLDPEQNREFGTVANTTPIQSLYIYAWT